MGNVEDAIILAGGMGTRMLPASLYAPKETMPMVDTPILNHLIWEATKAGASRIHLVLTDRKKSLLDQFIGIGPIYSKEVRQDLPRDALSLGSERVEVISYLQESPGGVANAISSAIDSINGAFLVLLGDMLLLERHLGPKYSGYENASNASKLLVSSFEKNGEPCVGIFPVQRKYLCNYGVVGLDGDKVVSIKEKPLESEAPSNYVLCGRYLFTKETSKILEMYPVSEFGELQSIALLEHFVSSQVLNAIKFDGMRMYDSGDPFSWLKSQVDHALLREDIGDDFSIWLRERLDETDI